jgi:hypothetical protein
LFPIYYNGILNISAKLGTFDKKYIFSPCKKHFKGFGVQVEVVIFAAVLIFIPIIYKYHAKSSAIKGGPERGYV